MKSPKQLVSSVVLAEGIKFLEKNPIENFPKLLNWIEKLVILPDHKEKLRFVKDIWNDKNSNGNIFIRKILMEVHPNVLKKFAINFFINSALAGIPLAERLKNKYACNIPWAILMDPTASCNLRCTGCWAEKYHLGDSLDNNTLDDIIRQGKQLGIYMYLYSGGEPLVRKHDLIQLAEKHHDCMFLAFTNATLIDKEFARDLQRVGNFLLAVSIEGNEEETDFRRGKGTYEKIIRAMDILKEHGIGFGFSTCYHRKNTESVGSDAYIDFMIEKGCLFGWYFTYIPLGQDASLDLLATPEQREYMYYRVRKARKEKPIFLLDFWNDGEFVNGCIAGGKNYLHINANGDEEPCAFIHYANVNIKDVSLLEALQSPLFRQYRQNQPFNNNHLRPCPLLDNPHRLKAMVQEAGAYSTQPLDTEPVGVLTDKCQDISQKWAVVADKIWHGQIF